MKIHNVEQGSVEWFRLRIGIPTASEFGKIVTPAKGALSAQWRAYAARLIWEKLVNTTTQSLDGIEHIEEGKRLEPLAVRQFEFTNEVKTEKIGFVTTDDGLIGASPDRFIIGQAKCLEVKCPTGPVHMKYALFGHEEAYRPQIQGQLLVCELEEGIFYSYVERAPAYQMSTARDETYIKTMKAALDQFNDHLQEYTEKAKSLGVFQAFADVAAPIDAAYEDVARGELDDVMGGME
jgi:hypothetical protein